MANKKKKGDRTENQVFEIFRKWDYIVEPAHRTMRRIWGKGKTFFVSQRNDIWGLFDGMAKFKNRETVYFQVKSDKSDMYKARKPIAQFANDYGCIEKDKFQIWLKIPRKGFKVYELYESTHIKCEIANRWKEFFVDLNGVIKDENI